MVDKSRVEAEWTARGFSCDLWVDPPGQCWEDFVHPMDELFMVVEGEVEVEIEGKVTHATPGEEFFIPSHVAHSVRNRGNTKSRWLYGYRQQ